MQQTILTILLAIFGALLLPPVWDRLMGAAPDWAWRLLFFVFVGVGVGLILLQPPIYPRLRNAGQYPISATLIGALSIAVVGAAAIWFLVIPLFPRAAPQLIEFSAVSSDAEYPRGTVKRGITWSPRFAELHVRMANSTTESLEDVDVVVRPDQPIAAIAQDGDLPGVSISAHGEVRVNPELLDPQTGRRVALPMALMATTGGYRVLVNRLPAKTELHLLLATASVDEAPHPPREYTDRRNVLALNFSEGARLWFGFGTDEIFHSKRIAAKAVYIKGTFTLSPLRT